MIIRRIMQLYFLLLYLWAGYQFFSLVESTLAGDIADFSLRFPVIETFLPLSALVGLKQLISTGVFDQIHPAGLSILLIAFFSALVFRRGICSHICPIGTLSEILNYGRNQLLRFKIPFPRIVHYLLMLPKYILLLFFIQVILMQMSGADAASFIYSSYNIISDAKMLAFFLNPSPLMIKVIGSLVVMTILIPFFWCRYLCPYGALLNIAAIFSPLQIRRQPNLCDSCGICDKQCPTNIQISKSTGIISPECTCCQRCISACPTKAITFHNRLTAKALKPVHYSIALLLLFVIGIISAQVSGHWNSLVLPLFWAKYLPQISVIPHP
ncbi:Putative electron transport protein YccM [Sporomusa silvacetica DSM 10669]|uniref:Electron transport protein YccM n=1 Tax=Sporomusa silvacetica DSM 10669 TaxID=1123289 RepID=A0ABZ3IFX3_9FIRM|nr:4Fe-4S binding protein [Sporomusa silvacetica]OZC17042.1 putative electron transport protein YccM [Sporomusa silvacetica DSM 10669]